RWYFFTSSPPGNVRRFDEKMLTEVTRRFFLTLWNVYSFFVTYANIDHFTPGLTSAPVAPSELDRWLISELNQLIVDVDSAMEHYDPTEAGRKIESFVDELSNWYVRRSRRRFWKSENDADKLSAYNTLYHCLVTLSKLLAPLTPFLAEELYQNLVLTVSPQAPESVHLTDFPVADESKIDKRLSDNIRKAMEYSSKGRAVRSKAGIKVRQPLAVSYASFGMEQALKSEAIRQSVLDELNVKGIKLATPEELAAMAKNPDYVVDDEAAPSTAIYKHLSEDHEEAEQLRKEGMAREVVHRLQTMRRADGFDIADHIITYYQGDDYIKQVLHDFADDIKQETLSRQLVEGVPEQGVLAQSYKLDGHEIKLGVKKLD
ncbi:MAG: isoleucyl-tRNA synthase, partial [Dehalococcoidales bacterium]|nr:isoleucyl-tRNA synthase [Dehalococcoidales bacterium]